MLKGRFEELRDCCARNVCAEHHTRIFPVWNETENSYVIRCQKQEYPANITEDPGLVEMYKQGEDLPPAVEEGCKKILAMRTKGADAHGVLGNIDTIPTRDLATGKQLAAEQIAGLIAYAERYGLDPYRQHVVLMYGKPYITFDGYVYHARRDNLDFQLRSRPMSPEERALYQAPEGSHAWLSDFCAGDGRPLFQGIGIVTLEEMTELSKGDRTQLRSPVVAKHPWIMAQKRSEWQAMRRGAPIGGEE